MVIRTTDMDTLDIHTVTPMVMTWVTGLIRVEECRQAVDIITVLTITEMAS
jgi:hypothetical protein